MMLKKKIIIIIIFLNFFVGALILLHMVQKQTRIMYKVGYNSKHFKDVKRLGVCGKKVNI